MVKSKNREFPGGLVVWLLSCVRLFVTVWTVALPAPHPWDFPGKNAAVGCRFLLQGIFPTQGSNPCLLHCRWILYHLSHQESPRILQWVAYPFARGSSHLRNQTRVSCIVGWFFTSWATHNYLKGLLKHVTGPHPQSFWLSRSGEEPENLHFNKFSGVAADLRTPLAELPVEKGHWNWSGDEWGWMGGWARPEAGKTIWKLYHYVRCDEEKM